METNTLNYDHCLRPTDTQLIVQKLSRNQHLNIVGTNPIHGTTRLLKDVKALETQLSTIVIVYINLREYKRSFDLFIQEVATQIGIIEEVKDFSKLSYHLRQKATTHQIWLLFDELDIAIEENHGAYSYSFLEQLNSFKNTTNISLLCTTSKNLDMCSVITPDGSYGTSPLVLPSKKIDALTYENITKALAQQAIEEDDFVKVIHKHQEPHRFMKWLIQQVHQQKPHQKKWSTRKKLELWEVAYKKEYKILPHQWWRKQGNKLDKFLITSGLIRIKHLKDWILAGIGGGD